MNYQTIKNHFFLIECEIYTVCFTPRNKLLMVYIIKLFSEFVSDESQ